MTTDFSEWLAREMPAGTVIGNPLWWASKIVDYRARALLDQPELTDDRLMDIACATDLVYCMGKGCGFASRYQEEADITAEALAFARAVIAADRTRRALQVQPEPAAPTDEDFEDLAEVMNVSGNPVPAMRRALELWGTPAIQPVPVSERLPEPSVKVLAHYLNALGKGRTICAIWVPAKSRSDEGDLDADDFLEYDEESDKYHWPEGWYEAIENWEELGWAKVYEGEIAYWQPLPQWPANALPTPEAQ